MARELSVNDLDKVKAGQYIEGIYDWLRKENPVWVSQNPDRALALAEDIAAGLATKTEAISAMNAGEVSIKQK